MRNLTGDGIIKLFSQEDLTQIYNRARIFVAPTRFGAGIPVKVLDAAARGIPVVTTRLIARQLNWQEECDLLVADHAKVFADQCIRLYSDSNLWQRLRTSALDRVSASFNHASFDEAVARILYG